MDRDSVESKRAANPKELPTLQVGSQICLCSGGFTKEFLGGGSAGYGQAGDIESDPSHFLIALVGTVCALGFGVGSL
jgi:hypothetical protein